MGQNVQCCAGRDRDDGLPDNCSMDYQEMRTRRKANDFTANSNGSNKTNGCKEVRIPPSGAYHCKFDYGLDTKYAPYEFEFGSTGKLTGFCWSSPERVKEPGNPVEGSFNLKTGAVCWGEQFADSQGQYSVEVATVLHVDTDNKVTLKGYFVADNGTSGRLTFEFMDMQ
eukprot:TRINITY_DN75728_c0_g1_i1.p1 TRINITY_DN75728_c0_g1~~TRINITY_DN75728_c0_g1_i1.p1  ORF type:complete len:169 (-),score=21.92 TRINITY_DN75728_c0_g1_i1:153-659(-)